MKSGFGRWGEFCFSSGLRSRGIAWFRVWGLRPISAGLIFFGLCLAALQWRFIMHVSSLNSRVHFYMRYTKTLGTAVSKRLRGLSMHCRTDIQRWR